MSTIKFSIAAKTDPGCVRSNNEDNLQAAADLSRASMGWVNNETYDLGEKGALLVVADGMGGMNAGEVASDIAINTVREFFAADKLTPEVTKNSASIEKYMKEVVVQADQRIKKASTDETRGMGTTIVMAWLIDGLCHVCWCGDSRAYIFNPANGLFQVSKDHSYVQTLVDAGKITEEQAFDYPQSNVITRCLCDADTKAIPDCPAKPQPLCDGDVILLCSDGLSGMLRDRDITQILKAGTEDMNECVDHLITAALRAGGNDNVTVAAARIISGGQKATPDRVPGHSAAPAAAAPALEKTPTIKPGENKAESGKKGTPAWVWALVGFVAAAAIFAAVYFLVFKDNAKVPEAEATPDQTTVPAPETSVPEATAEPQPAGTPANAGTRMPAMPSATRHSGAPNPKAIQATGQQQQGQQQQGQQQAEVTDKDVSTETNGGSVQQSNNPNGGGQPAGNRNTNQGSAPVQTPSTPGSNQSFTPVHTN